MKKEGMRRDGHERKKSFEKRLFGCLRCVDFIGLPKASELKPRGAESFAFQCVSCLRSLWDQRHRVSSPGTHVVAPARTPFISFTTFKIFPLFPFIFLSFQMDFKWDFKWISIKFPLNFLPFHFHFPCEAHLVQRSAPRRARSSSG